MVRLLFTFLLLTFTLPANAFYCELETAHDKYHSSDAVFIAKIDNVENVGRKLGSGFGTNELKISAQLDIIFKGLEYDSTHVIFFTESAFNIKFRKGGRYLIYAHRLKGDERINVLDCPRPQIFEIAQAEIAAINTVKYQADYASKIKATEAKQNSPVRIVVDDELSATAESAFYEIPLEETEWGKKQKAKEEAEKKELDERAKKDIVVFDSNSNKPKETNNLDDFDNLFNIGESTTGTPQSDEDLLKEDDELLEDLPDLNDPENPYF